MVVAGWIYCAYVRRVVGWEGGFLGFRVCWPGWGMRGTESGGMDWGDR